MKFQRRKVAVAIGYALGAGGMALVAAGSALAQDVRVDVTGTNIKRVEAEGALPVQIITREEIQRSGVQSSTELMQRISAVSSSGTFNEITGVGSSLTGFAGVSLRGLGVERTLVLLNGRRLSNYSIAGAAVDVNTIPVTAIERVEVLKDGASAIYGTDAVAGVINFIMRKDFTGIDAYAYYGDSEAGGGKQWRTTITGGWGDLTKDRFNVFGMYDYVKTDPIHALQRSFSKTVYRPDIGMDSTSANSIPASIGQPGGFAGSRNPGAPGCLPPFSIVTTNPQLCRFDFGATINIMPPSEKQTVLGKFTWQLNPDNQLFAEGSWYQGKFLYAISPTPVNSAILGSPFVLRPSSPFYPTAFVASLPGGNVNLPLELSWRALDTGPRTNESTVDTYRGVVGLQGIIRGWDYSTALTYNENKIADNYTTGNLDAGRLAAAFNTGTINPFAPNTGAALALLSGTQISEQARATKGSTVSWDGRASNDIYKLPAGPLAMAVGGEWRREELQQNYSDNYINGTYVGGAGAIPPVADKSRTVYAGFIEFNIPVVKTVEANVALRYDHYSDFGSTANPKATLRWQPTTDVLLRGSYGTGFRAPSLSDLYQPLLTTNTGGNYSDPLRCPFTASTVDCSLQYDIKQGGNPLLKPEKSTNWTLGVVWSPTAAFSVGVDYYNIEITDVIVLYPELAAVVPFLSQAVSGFNAQGLGVQRRPVDPNFPNLPGPIDFFGDPLFNLGKIKTSGLDIDVKARGPATPAGRFTFGLSGTYVIDFKESDPATGEILTITGTRSAGLASSGAQGAVARWRHYMSGNWQYGPWNATIAQNYQHGYTEYPETAAAATIFGDSRRVGAYTIWDLQGQYQGIKNLTLTLGVKNLFDRDPPLSIVNQGFVLGWDKLYADPTGRFFYGSVRYAFK